MQRITQEYIRDTNRRMIYMYIYRRHGVMQQDIARHLKMSRPTVTVHLSAMEDEGLISRSVADEYNIADNKRQSSSGRRPIKWAICEQHKIALGVEILKDAVKMIAVNLYGTPLKCAKFKTEYSNTEKYYEYITGKVKEFIASLGIGDPEKKNTRYRFCPSRSCL